MSATEFLILGLVTVVAAVSYVVGWLGGKAAGQEDASRCPHCKFKIQLCICTDQASGGTIA